MRDEVGKTTMEVSKKEIRKVLSISKYGPILEFPKKTKTNKKDGIFKMRSTSK